METFGQAYPATLDVDRAERIANWRPIVQWLLAIPHWAILNALQDLSGVVGVISWFVILFTGRLPEALANLQCLIIRYGNRTYAYAGFLREEYPPFTFETVAPADPGSYPPVRTRFGPELENRNRLTVGFRIVLLIPQVIVLAVLVVAVFVAWVIALFAVLSLAAGPKGCAALSWASCVGAHGSAPISSCSPTSTRRSASSDRLSLAVPGSATRHRLPLGRPGMGLSARSLSGAGVSRMSPPERHCAPRTRRYGRSRPLAGGRGRPPARMRRHVPRP